LTHSGGGERIPNGFQESIFSGSQNEDVVADTITTIVTVASGLVSGTGVALLTYLLTRKKTQAEIKKVQAEAERTLAETERIRLEVKNLSGAVTYSLDSSAEEILFDGTQHVDGFDVKGKEGRLWTDDSKPASEMGRGNLRFEDGGVLNVQRENIAGRFELWFQRYIYKGNEHPVIPKDVLISGKRKLRVSCDAKVVDGKHSLRFVVKNPSSGKILADERVSVESNEWTSFQVFLPADPNQDSVLRVDDEAVSAPSSVQIRSFVLARRN